MPGPKDKKSFKPAPDQIGKTNTAQNINSSPSLSLKPTTLLPTDKIIELAKLRGVDFGPGDPNERIRYYIKLEILPHQVRKAPDPQKQIAPVGHLPFSTVQTLVVADRLKQRGFTYPQIAQRLKESQKRHSSKQSDEVTATKLPIEPEEPKPALQFLNKKPISVGDIEKRLEEHRKYVEQIIQEQIILNKPISQHPASPQQASGNSSSRLNESDLKQLANYNRQPAVTNPEPGTYSVEVRQTPEVLSSVKSHRSLYLNPTPVLALVVLISLAMASLIFTSSGVQKATRSALQTPQGEPTTESELKAVANANLSGLGQVLAASTTANVLYIDATTNVKGETTFEDNITAPNIVYSVTGGTGITVTGGQNPVVSLAATGIVSTLNNVSGALTIQGSGGTSVSTSGSTITISSTSSSSSSSSTSETLATVTARGATTSTASTFSGGLTVGTSLSFSDTDSTVILTNAGTMSFTDATNTLFTIMDQGSYGTIKLSDKGTTGNPATCTTGEIYFNGTDSTINACTATNTWEQLDAGGGGGITSLSLAGDSGTTQTLTDGNTITVAGGTNGIDTVAGATDTVTLNLDTTEIGTTTFGTGSGITWTFDVGATDPTFTFASDQVTVAAATAVLSGTTTLTASSLATLTTAASLSATSTTTLTLGTSATINANATALNLQADGSIDVNIAGGSGTTGCTIANSTGNLTCAGNITGSSSGTVGFWSRSGTTLTTATAGDDVYTTGRLAVGTTTSSFYQALVYEGLTSNLSQARALGVIADVTHTSGTSNGYYGYTVTASIYPTVNASSLQANFTQAFYGGTTGGVTVTQMDGTFSRVGISQASPTGTVTNATSFYIDAPTNQSTGTATVTFTNNTGLYVGNQGTPSAGSGLSITNAYGVHITPQTGAATTNIGLCFDCDGTWTSSTVGAGIQFGTDANAVTLYRSASDTLKTDDSFAIDGGTLSTGATTFNLVNATATTVNFAGAATTLNIGPTGSGAGNIVLAGGSADTGCTLDQSNGNLTCSGNVTGSSSGTAGFWTRTSTTLSPATANDIVSITASTASSNVLALSQTNGSGTGNVFQISNSGTGFDIGFTKETNHTVSVDTSTTSATAGGNLTILSGAGSTSGAGGTLALTGGAGGTTGTGGIITITTGAGGSTSGNSGALTIGTGTPTSGNSGAVILQSANGSAGTNGSNSGSVTVQSGAGGAGTGGGSGASAGNLRLIAGAGGDGDFAGGAGGLAFLRGGAGGAATGGTAFLGGVAGGISMWPGNGGNSAGSGTGGAGGAFGISLNDGGTSATGTAGAGGAITLAGGAGGSTSGAGTAGSGGAFTVTAGNAGTGSATTGAAGGAISLTAGTSSLAVTGGAVSLTAGQGGATGAGGGITITTGAGGGTSGNSGTLTLDTGSVTSGTVGGIDIGTSSRARTITVGNGTGATALNLTSGTGAQTFTSSATSGTAFSFVSNAITTGNALTLSSTSTTTGEILDLTGTWAPTDSSNNEAIDINISHAPTTAADTFQAINLTTTDATALANTVYNLQSTLTMTGNAAKTGYGLYSAVSTSSTTADTTYSGYFTGSMSSAISTGTRSNYGVYSTITVSGVTSGGASNVYGLYSTPLNSGANSGGTVNIYASYLTPRFSPAGDSTGSTQNLYGAYITPDGQVHTGGTINIYGVYLARGNANTTGTSTAYGIYVEPQTSTDTGYGICFDCDGSYTSSTVASGIQFGTDANAVTLYRSASDVLKTDDSLLVGTNLTVTGTTTLNGTVALGDATGDDITFTGYVASSILPKTDDTYDLGDNTHRWQDLYLGPQTLHIGTSTTDEAILSYTTATNTLLLDNVAAGIINIGTTALAQTITVGNGTGATSLAFTSGTGAQTHTSSVATTTAFSFVSNAITTGNALTLSSTATTTGEIVDITGTFAPADGSTNEAIDINITHTPTVSADNFQSINLTTTDGTALANTVYGISNTITLSGNAAKTAFGFRSDITSSSTTADLLYSGYFLTSATGNAARGTNIAVIGNAQSTSTTADNLYGLYAITAKTGSVVTGTMNNFGVFSAPSTINPDADSNAVAYVYGFYTSVTGTNDVAGLGSINAYGLYVANGTTTTVGTSTKYGIYVESPTGADNNYAAIFAGGNVGIGDTSPDTTLELSGTTAPKLSLSDTGLAHGITDWAATDSFFQVEQITDDDGGVRIWGLSDAAGQNPLRLFGAFGSTDPTDTVPAIWLLAAKRSGTGVANLGAAETALQVSLADGSTHLMTILGNGNVGLGDSVPDTMLHITGSAPVITLDDNSGTIGTGTVGQSNTFTCLQANRTPAGTIIDTGKATSSLCLSAASGDSSILLGTIDTNNTAPTTRMTIDSGGDVGIGTSPTAAYRLDTSTPVDVNNLSLFRTTGTGQAFSVLQTAGGANSIHTDAAGDFGIDSSGVAASVLYMVHSGAVANTITLKSGMVGIGTASPTTAVNNLHLYRSNTTTTAQFKIEQASTGDASMFFIRSTNIWTFGIDGSASDVLKWSTDNSGADVGVSTQMTLDRSGNLTLVGNCSDAAGGGGCTADYAEAYQKDLNDPLEKGDLLSLNEQTGKVTRADQFNNKLVGVFSSAPGALIGQRGSSIQLGVGGKVIENLDPDEVPVALTGRVPMKVSTQNGPIMVGDSITFSSTPGVGMKATKPGRVVGMAMESFNAGGIDKITIFVNPTYYLGVNLASNGSIENGDGGQGEGAPQLAENIINPDGTLNEQYQGQILTADQIAALVHQEVARQLTAQGGTTQQAQSSADTTTSNTNCTEASPLPTPSPTPSPSSSPEASGSAEATASGTVEESICSGEQLANQTDQNLNDLNQLLSTTNLELDTLRVNGNTQLAQTQVAGAFSQDGTLVIDYGRQINVLGSTLFLQNDSLSGDQTTGIVLDIAGGRVTIAANGNIATEGVLKAQEVLAQKITIDTSTPEKKTVGSAQIAQGQSSVFITTSAVNQQVKILVTATTPTGGKALYVAQKQDLEGFTVSLDPQTPTLSDIDFDWLIISTSQLSSN